LGFILTSRLFLWDIVGDKGQRAKGKGQRAWSRGHGAKSKGHGAPVKSSFGGLPPAAFNGVNIGHRVKYLVELVLLVKLVKLVEMVRSVESV